MSRWFKQPVWMNTTTGTTTGCVYGRWFAEAAVETREAQIPSGFSSFSSTPGGKPYIFVARHLIAGYKVLERRDGYARLLITWEGGRDFEGWVSEHEVN